MQEHANRIKEAIINGTIVSYEDGKRIIMTAKWSNPDLRIDTPEEYTAWRNSLKDMKNILPENPEEYYKLNR